MRSLVSGEGYKGRQGRVTEEVMHELEDGTWKPKEKTSGTCRKCLVWPE